MSVLCRHPSARVALVWALLLSSSAFAVPEVQVVPCEKAYVGRTCQVVYEVTWAGEPDEYAILAAEIEAFDWGTARVSEVSATVRGGENVVRQVVELTPTAPGIHDMPQVTIPFVDKQAITQQAAPEPGPEAAKAEPPALPTLQAETFRLRVVPSNPLYWVMGGFGGLLALGVLLVVWRLLRRSKGAAEPAQEPVPTGDLQNAQRFLHEAKRHQVDGDFYRFYLALAGAAEAVNPEDADTASKLKTRAQDVGYGGVNVEKHEADSDYRTVERALRKRVEESDS